MHRRAPLIVLFIILAVISSSTVLGAVGEPGPQQKQQQPARKKADQGSSLTGCVDQQDGRYVLIDERSLAPIADLVAEGFPTEGFAKHVGHKVIVRGTSSSGDARPVVKVRSVETLSETCTPQQQGKV